MNFLSNKSTSCKRCALAREEIIASQVCDSTLSCMKRALPGSNRIQRIQFEVSEDLKSSSVGANHWSPRPIAPSRAPAQRNVVQNVIDQSFGEM